MQSEIKINRRGIFSIILFWRVFFFAELSWCDTAFCFFKMSLFEQDESAPSPCISFFSLTFIGVTIDLSARLALEGESLSNEQET